MPSVEVVQKELATAKSVDDFFGKDGIFSRLFTDTLGQMLETELTEELGYERYEAKGRNSGNSRNGNYQRKMRTSGAVVVERLRLEKDASWWARFSHKASAPDPMLPGPANQQKRFIRFLRLGFWMGAVIDFLVALAMFFPSLLVIAFVVSPTSTRTQPTTTLWE
jgi:hypothetical protein